MSEANIRAGIKSILTAIPGIGKVHDYERYPEKNDWSAFLALFKNTNNGQDHILGWTITRRSSGEKHNDPIPHVYLIRGIMGMKDSAETDKSFTALIENVRAAFRNNKTISNAALGHDYIQVSFQELRFFGSVLCHYCELTIVVYEGL